LPVSPDIEGVPDTSPATIVEKRKYKDFSIFCPGVFGVDNENNTNIIEPEFSISNSNGNKLVWCNAWLNVNSGKVEINIFWNSNIYFDYKREDGVWERHRQPKNSIKWDYMNNPDGQEEFLSKLEKTINGRISEKAQNKIINDFEKLYSGPSPKFFS
jgi:hypothetical protein